MINMLPKPIQRELRVLRLPDNLCGHSACHFNKIVRYT